MSSSTLIGPLVEEDSNDGMSGGKESDLDCQLQDESDESGYKELSKLFFIMICVTAVGAGSVTNRKAEDANFKPNFSFFTSLSTTEAHVCGVKFIEFYGTVGFIGFGTFPFEERAICGVTSGQRSMKWSAFFFF